MDTDDDVSPDELFIDEEQDYRKRNNFSLTRGHHNAYSSNVGAYNDALLGFGGRGNARSLNPPFSNKVASFTEGTANHTITNSSYNIPAKSRTSSHKRAKKSGKVSTQRLDITDTDRTTAENRVSSSSFLNEINMAMRGSLTSYNMENDSSYWGAGKMSNHVLHKRSNNEFRRKQPKMNAPSPSQNLIWSRMQQHQVQPHQFSNNISGKKQCPKITQYIADKPARLKSYFRRRHVPFKRTYDMNLQCGTTSLLVQISDDIEECLYHGDERLVEQFLDTGQGVNLSLVNQIIQQEKGHRRLGRSSLDDRSKSKSQQFTDFEKNDEDFFATSKEKEQKEKEKRKEAQQRLIEGDYLSNISDRNKAFKSRKDALIGKMAETDEVCATKSFLVVLNHDNDAIFYYGHPTLVTKFFTTGLTRNCVTKTYNIRMFESEEFDQNSINTCAVPQCVVTRNTLSKWRIAAMELFEFPSHLPMTLYTCSESEKEKWIAELDLNPETAGRIAVCSLHFMNGEPTEDCPLPTELLSHREGKPLRFRGNCKPPFNEEANDKVKIEDKLCDKSVPQNNRKLSVDIDKKPYFTQLISKKSRKFQNKRKRLLKAISFRRRKRIVVAESISGEEQSIRTRRRNLAIFTNFGSKLLCRFCAQFCKNTSEYLLHIRSDHLHLASKNKCSKVETNFSVTEKKPVDTSSHIKKEDIVSIKNIENTINCDDTQKERDSTSLLSSLEKLLTSIKVEEMELESLLRDLYPFSTVKTMNPRKKYVCAVCKSVCDLFGLFTHMKTVHQGLLCQYCLKLFKKVADLEVHLNKVHFVYRRYYSNKDSFKEYSGDAYTFACTACSSLVPFENLEVHKCENMIRQYDCPYCDRPFGQKQKLELHMSNGWCKAMPWMLKIEYDNENYQSSMLLRSKRLAVLTGRKNNETIDDETIQTFESESRIYEPALWNVHSSQSTIHELKTVQPVHEKHSPNKSALNFNPWDRNFLNKYSNPLHKTDSPIKTPAQNNVIIEDIPNTGSIFCSSKGRGINQLLKEETEIGQKFDITQKFLDAKSSCLESNMNLNASIARMQIFKSKSNFFIQNNRELIIRQSSISAAKAAKAIAATQSERKGDTLSKRKSSVQDDPTISTTKDVISLSSSKYQPNELMSVEDKENISNQEIYNVTEPSLNQANFMSEASMKSNLPIKRESKAERMLRMSAEIEMGFSNLRKAIDHYASDNSQSINKNTEANHDETMANGCSLCQQARTITVDAIFIYNHLATHDEQQTKNILKEDPADAISRLKKYFRDSRLQEMLFQYTTLSYDSDCPEDQIDVKYGSANGKHFLTSGTYSCCSCSNSSSVTYNQLLEHLSTAHSSKVLTCQLCQNIFLNYGSFISHVCYGPLKDAVSQPRAKFSCKICDRHDLQSFLEFQYHIRKKHNTCEICFYRCTSQEELYEHCIKHTNELMCMKCFRAYDDQQQLRKHLYFNHQAEHQICAQCHHKSWPHVYHFCLINSAHENTCEVCDKSFDDFQKYRVHFRIHTGINPHKCSSQGCEKSYISKQLLNKHKIRRHPELKEEAEKQLQEKRELKEMVKYGATKKESIGVIGTIIDEIVSEVIQHPMECDEGVSSDVSPGKEHTEPEIDAAEILANLGDTTVTDSLVPQFEDINQLDNAPPEEYDPVAAAVSSIMDIDSMFNIKKSPVKNHPISPHRENRLPLHSNSDMKSSKISLGTSILSQSATKLEHQIPICRPKILGQVPNNLASHGDISKQTQFSSTKASSKSTTIFHPSSVKEFFCSSSSSKDVHPTNPSISTQSISTAPSEKTVEKADQENKCTILKSSTQCTDEVKESHLEPKISDSDNSSQKAHPPDSGVWNQDLKETNNEYPKLPQPEFPDSHISQVVNTSSSATIDNLDSTTINKQLVTGQGWDVDLSESSGDSETEGVAPKKARTVKIKERRSQDVRITLRDHDYCFESYLTSVRPPPKPEVVEDLSEMDKILSNVAMGASIENTVVSNDVAINVNPSNDQLNTDTSSVGIKKHKKPKKNKKKKKKKHKRKSYDRDREGGSSSSDSELDVVNSAIGGSKKTPKLLTALPKGPKPKFHTPTGAAGITAAAARPNFSSSDEKDSDSDDNSISLDKPNIDNESSSGDIASSDLETDFSADDLPPERITTKSKRSTKPSIRMAEAAETKEFITSAKKECTESKKPVKLKIKLSKPLGNSPATIPRKNISENDFSLKTKINLKPKKATTPSAAAAARRQARLAAANAASPLLNPSKKKKHRRPSLLDSSDTSKMSDKMKRSLALNRGGDTESESDLSSNDLEIAEDIEHMQIPENNVTINHSLIDTKVYCYCQSPHDDVSEMIGCDAPDCKLEWFHFECVGIMVPPEGQWYCPECSKKYHYQY